MKKAITKSTIDAKKKTSSPFIVHSKNWFRANRQVDIRSKLKSTLIAILLGVFVTFLITFVTMKQNPFNIFGTLILTALKNVTMLNETLVFTSLLIVSGLANAIAFKTGLFNIGVSGQMFFSGTMSVILGLTLVTSFGLMGLVILVWFGAIIGGVVAGFVGWLKAKFNVNEVVTSILLNWILFYIARYIIKLLSGNSSIGTGGGGTQTLPREFQISGNFYGIVLFMIGLVIALIVAVLLWKSTFGHAMTMTGKSNNVSKYAGINVNMQIIMSMAISGMISGFLGVMYFVISQRQVAPTFMQYNQLPQIGFYGIAIALLAFSNPIAIIPISLIFGILQSGAMGLTEYGMDNSFANLMIGIVMYFATVAVLFMRFKPIELFYTWHMINKKHFPKEYEKIEQDYLIMNDDYREKSYKNEEAFLARIKELQDEVIAENKWFEKEKKKLTSGEAKLQLQELKKRHIAFDNEIKLNEQHIKDIDKGYKNINNYRATQLKLMKIKKLKEYYDETHKFTYAEPKSKKSKADSKIALTLSSTDSIVTPSSIGSATTLSSATASSDTPARDNFIKNYVRKHDDTLLHNKGKPSDKKGLFSFLLHKKSKSSSIDTSSKDTTDESTTTKDTTESTTTIESTQSFKDFLSSRPASSRIFVQKEEAAQSKKEIPSFQDFLSGKSTSSSNTTPTTNKNKSDVVDVQKKGGE